MRVSLQSIRLRARRVVVVALLLWTGAIPARGQDVQALPTTDPADRAPIRFGPFYLLPTLAVTDIGIDTNVFNDDQEPQEDFTLTLVPRLEAGLRVGPVRATFVDDVQYVWFKELKSERSVNGLIGGEFEVRWTRLRPFIRAEAARTRQRQGDEIDARARRTSRLYASGVDIGVASRTWIALEYRYATSAFDEGEVYEGVDLARALNNVTQTASVGLRFELTPLTSFAITVRAEKARFDESAFRDSDSYMILGVFDFDPDALLAGQATIGYRNLQARSVNVADFRGLVGSVAVTYSAPTSTRLGVTFGRNPSFSFEDLYPYFLSTDIGVSVTQRIAGPFEVNARGRRAWLEYSPLEGAALERTDMVDSYGAGVGYRLGDFSRLGFNVERIERRSDVPSRGYLGTRYFGSVAYGF